MTDNPTKTTLLERLKAFPQFREAKSPSWNGRIGHSDPGEGIIIVGAKPSVAQKPQAGDVAPHGEDDERGNAS